MPVVNEAIKFRFGLQSNFDSIQKKEVNTIYFCTDSQRLFLGDMEYSRPVISSSSLPEDYKPKDTLCYNTSDKGLYLWSGSAWQLVAKQLTIDPSDFVAANEPITAGTHAKISYDEKGLVTGGSELTASDIPNITMNKITDAGTAAKKDVATDAIIQDSSDVNLVTAAQVATFVKSQISGISGAMHFKGIVTELPESGSPGDVVVIGNKEYVYVDNKKKWKELGDETIYAIKGEIKNSDIASDANIDQSKINGLTKVLKDVAHISDIPSTLPNPSALTVGSKSYDGSAAVTLTKSDIDLGKVDNTADSEKSVLKAVQDAEGNVINETYATKSELSSVLTWGSF